MYLFYITSCNITFLEYFENCIYMPRWTHVIDQIGAHLYPRGSDIKEEVWCMLYLNLFHGVYCCTVNDGGPSRVLSFQNLLCNLLQKCIGSQASYLVRNVGSVKRGYCNVGASQLQTSHYVLSNPVQFLQGPLLILNFNQ
jgi:hypothetical protein